LDLAGVILDLHRCKAGYLPLLHYIIVYCGLNLAKRVPNLENVTSLLEVKVEHKFKRLAGYRLLLLNASSVQIVFNCISRLLLIQITVSQISPA